MNVEFFQLYQKEAYLRLSDVENDAIEELLRLMMDIYKRDIAVYLEDANADTLMLVFESNEQYQTVYMNRKDLTWRMED